MSEHPERWSTSRLSDGRPEILEFTETGPVSMATRQPFLIVLESTAVGEPGRVIPIGSGVTIGRSDADIVVKDNSLSRRHIEISELDGVCRIRDLNSRNGTRVNGVSVASADLSSGDQIRVGTTLLQYQNGSEAQSHKSILRSLGDIGVALWEYHPGAGDLVFSEHADPALDLPRGTLSRARMPIALCVHPDDRERVQRALAATGGGTALELEVRLQVSSLERWVALRGSAGDRGVVSGTVVNITASKRREATLTRTALMFESFSDGVVLTDDDDAIVDVNSAMATSFGVSRREAIGRTVFAILPVGDPARRSAEIREALGRCGRFSGTMQTAGDTVFDVLVFRLLTDRGEGAGAAWVLRDVTEKSRMASRLAFLDRLASLGTMSAGVAHEINNPLTFVLSNAEYLRESLPADQHAPLVEAVDEIVEGANRISAIVRDLKTFARADASAEPAPTNPRTAIELATKMVKSLAGSRVRIAPTIRSERWVLAVESHLVQVLVNLLVNAVQAMPDDDAGSTITIDVVDAGDSVAIDVIDRGTGMSAETAARAFDPFFTTRPLRGGTGLGLSICHGLVTQMAGAISLISQLGAGTTARVSLRAAIELRAEEHVQAAEPASPRLRILVIDDEPLLLRAIERILKDQQVVTADSYTAATRVLFEQRETFDAILCDLMMPDGTGMDIFARIQSERPELAPRILFVTGAAFTQASQHFLDTTTAPHLLKPVDRKTLRRILFQVAAQASARVA